MKRRSLAVISAGLRQPSSTRLLGDRLATAAQQALTAQGAAADFEVIELRELAHDLTNNLLTGFPSADLRTAVETVVAADGLIAVTPIFTASYSGLFKSFFDVLEDGSLAGKPVLMAATGGTERHSLALEHAMRPLFAYLRCLVVPTAVYAASSDWGRSDSSCSSLSARIDRAARELADQVLDYDASRTPDPSAALLSFEQLMVNR